MHLPDREHAFIPPAKLSNYLLSLSHPAGRSKARFLLAVGYRMETPEVLEQALLSIAYETEVTDMERSAHGVKYVIEGQVQAPRGHLIRLRTIWIIEEDHPPRFVTAYPRT